MVILVKNVNNIIINIVILYVRNFKFKLENPI